MSNKEIYDKWIDAFSDDPLNSVKYKNTKFGRITRKKFETYDRIYPTTDLIDRAIKSTGMACYYYKNANNEEGYYSALWELKMLKKYKNWISQHRMVQMAFDFKEI